MFGNGNGDNYTSLLYTVEHVDHASRYYTISFSTMVLTYASIVLGRERFRVVPQGRSFG